jgi:phosphoglycerate dehydrogenase-like enzyme
MQTVRTVSFPDAQLLADLSPLPEGLKGVVWDLKSDPDGGTLGEIDGVILPYINAGAVLGALAQVDNLKYVQTQSTGYDGVIEAAGPDAGVASASGVHAAATAELAVGLILAKLRGIDQAVRDQQHGLWRPERRFEVTVTRVGSSARTDEHGQVHASSELPALAATHDILVSVLPLNEQTHQLIGEEVLAALPDGALVVNVGRGPVVDTEALTKEVLSGRLNCALDVVDPEPLPQDHALWSAPNALITPHVGGNASAFEPRILKLLRKQLEALAAGQAPANLVQQGPF